ncbi:uncharacterized protein [Dysidea avara]
MSRRLLTTKPLYRLVGLDNFDPYYDVSLKHNRVNLLRKEGIKFHRGDVCDERLLKHILTEYHVTMVMHFAAQAGVRHSVNDPLAYIRSNVECFVTLLDTLQHYQGVRLLYASSSSVYGRDSPLPFSTQHGSGYPGNLYAASKLSNEMFADTYCSEYGVKSVGVRFFTVYGPWGRPDMAVYKFAKRITAGEAIPLFQSSSHEPLMRDFTYIDDVIDGLVSLTEVLLEQHNSVECGVVYNLGYGSPVAVDTMISYLEEELDKKAIVERLPLPPSEMLATFADIEDSQRSFNFHPTTNLRTGIKLFVQWYKDYHGDEMRSQSEGDETKYSKSDLDVMLLNKKVDQRNVIFQQRIDQLRNKYLQYAGQNDITLPDVSKKGYIFYPGRQSPGRVIMKAPSYKGHIEALKRRCSQTDQCVGFNTDAEFKTLILPENEWVKMEGNGAGSYVANIDMCAADLHDCHKHSQCVYKGPAQFECRCLNGYHGNGRQCVRIYNKDTAGWIQEESQLADYIDSVDWTGVLKGRKFIFFQGYDSPGGDYFIVPQHNTSVVMDVCLNTSHCIGFNTNGLIKSVIRPPHYWYYWTSASDQGLYVLDYDYCSLSEEVCPLHSQCWRHSPGNYSCSCDQGYKMTSSHDECIPDHVITNVDHVITDDVTMGHVITTNPFPFAPSTIHIILSVDHDHFQGLLATMNSILQHCTNPDQLHFHIVLARQPRLLLESYLQCHALLLPGQVEVKELNSDWLDGQVKVHSNVKLVGNLASQANFARFFFHRLFPSLTRAVYLDVDVIVREDVALLWQQVMKSDKLIQVVQRSSPSYGNMFSDTVKGLFEQRYGYKFKDDDASFNAGVFAINLELWAKGNYVDEALYWMKQNADRPLWQFGTQPVMLMLSHDHWDQLDHRWNIDGLGWNEQISTRQLDTGYLLHWSGRCKPWLEDGLYKSYWSPYYPMACNQHGVCRQQDTMYYCDCHHGYTGNTCSEQLHF